MTRMNAEQRVQSTTLFNVSNVAVRARIEIDNILGKYEAAVIAKEDLSTNSRGGG